MCPLQLGGKGHTRPSPPGEAHQTFLHGEGTPDPPLQGKHTRPSCMGRAHQTLPSRGSTPDLPAWGGHTRPSPLAEAHQTFLGRAHQTLPSSGGTPDLPGEGTPEGKHYPWGGHTRPLQEGVSGVPSPLIYSYGHYCYSFHQGSGPCKYQIFSILSHQQVKEK